MARTAAPHPVPAAPRNVPRTAALVFLTLALALSAWLVRLSLGSGAIAGCDAGNCGLVLGSKWAKVFGVPVGLFGGAAYLVLAVLGARPFDPRQRAARIAATAIALLIPAAALWFVALQVFVIHAFCPWCCTTHAIATVGAILMLIAWRRDAARPAATGRRAQGPAPARPVFGAAAAAATLAFTGLLVAQVLSPEPPKPRTVTASMSSPAPAAKTPPAPATPTTASNAAPATASVAPTATGSTTSSPPAPAVATVPPEQRRLNLHGGKFVVDPHGYPCNGSPDAEHVILMISDYTCPHCRAAYKLIKEVREVFDGRRLGITMLPSHHGGDSEELQNLMLSAWRVEPAVWADVAADLYLEHLPLRPDVVRQTLIQRLGPGRLEASLETSRPWIQSTVDLARAIHAANRTKTGSGSIPQFIVGDKIVVGSPVDAADLFHLLEENLHLVREQFPVLTLVRAEIDLGRIFAGTSPTITIPYTNTGKARLSISRATVPQGGKVLRGLQAPVEPGGTGTVEVAFNIPRDAGSFEQIVTLFSNARTNEQPFAVKGVAWKPIRITPPVLDLGRIDPDDPKIPEGVMRLELEENAPIASVQAQNPGFEAALREVTPGRVYEIVVHPTKSLPPGLQQSALRVSLRQPSPPGWPETVAVATRVLVERAVTVLPQRIYVPEGALATERHHQVLVRCNDGSPGFAVQGATLDGGPSFAQPQVQPGGKPNEFLVRFTLPAGWTLPPPPVETHLVIQTTHPKFPALEVPVSSSGR